MTTIRDLLAQSQELDARKTDYGKGWSFYFRGGKLFAQQGDQVVGPYLPTDLAVQQTCAKLGAGTYGKGSGRSLPSEPFIKWLRDADFADAASLLLNAHMGKVSQQGKVPWFVRTMRDGETDTVRAVLSQWYAPLSNTQMLGYVDQALDLFGEQRGTRPVDSVIRPYLTGDDMQVRMTFPGDAMVWPDGERGPYALGVYIGNNETGRGGIEAGALIQRTTCTNSIVIVGQEGAYFKQAHRGLYQLLGQQVGLVIGNALKLGAEYLVKLVELKRREIPDIFKVINEMAAREKWATPFTTAVEEGLEGGNSIYSLVNGFTYAAHKVYEEQPETMLAWEKRAGQIVVNPDSVFGRVYQPAVVEQ